MKKFILSLFLVSISFTGFSKVITISNSGLAYTPAAVTITFGDSIRFAISSTHDAVEVSKETWDANGATPLSGGFSLPKSGGVLIPEQLAIGTHFYVCTPHASFGMKGSIIVLGPTTIPSVPSLSISFFPNPASDFIFVKGTGLSGSDYQIIDITGKQISTGKLENIENKINIERLTSGIYFFQNLSQKELFRFIKN